MIRYWLTPQRQGHGGQGAPNKGQVNRDDLNRITHMTIVSNRRNSNLNRATNTW